MPWDNLDIVCSLIKLLSMMTSWNGNIFRVTGPLCGELTGRGDFPAQRPVTRSFDVFFDLRPNKRLSKQPRGWWFETPSWSLWRQCYAGRQYRTGTLLTYWGRVTHIYVGNLTSLVQITACRLFGSNPVPQLMPGYCQLDFREEISVKFEFHSRRWLWKCPLLILRPFCPGGDEFIRWLLVTTYWVKKRDQPRLM